MTISEPVQHVQRAVSRPDMALPANPRRGGDTFADALMDVALLAGLPT